jgi:predicted phage terminase large subunit-like protein
VTGYNERFARKFGRRSRNLAAELGLVGSDKTAADEWETTSGGLYMARGVGSPPTGTGFRLINIDDPIRRREDAESRTYRDKTWDWYTDDLYTRLEPGGIIVLVMTLWHEDDLGAKAVASEPGRWTVLKLKAIDDAGKALWAERYPVEALERIREVMRRNEGERSWEALYQQNPTPREGAFFRPGMLEIVDAIPAGLPACRAWDMAATENDGDYTAGVKMAGPDAQGLWYVVDIRRGRWGTDKRNQEIKAAALADGTAVKIRGPQDPGAAGKESARAFVRLLAGYDVKTRMVSGAKETRADPLSAQVNAGNVRLLRSHWNAAFIEELRTFPGGKHDDQIDAASDAFAELATTRKPTAWGVY